MFAFPHSTMTPIPPSPPDGGPPWFSSTRTIYALCQNFPPAPRPDEPYWFIKPLNSLVDASRSSSVSSSSNTAGSRAAAAAVVHRPHPDNDRSLFEPELGVLISPGVVGKAADAIASRSTCTLKNVPEADALRHVGGYFLALDMTDLRELEKARPLGRPWTRAKGWDSSCPVSGLVPLQEVPDWRDLELWLTVRAVGPGSSGRQGGDLRAGRGAGGRSVKAAAEEAPAPAEEDERVRCKAGEMHFGVEKLIAEISRMHTLVEGDMILCGCPAGAAEVEAGTVMRAGITGLGGTEMAVEVVVGVGGSSSTTT